jgi:hypothetical protein
MKIRNKKEKRIFKIIIIILFVFLIGYLFIINLKEKRDIPVSFSVSDKVGFDIDKESLTFGAIPLGGSGNRGIYINNSRSHKVKVTIYSYGDTKDYLTISQNDFILEKNEKKKIMFYIKIPKDAIKKKYEGKIVIEFKRKLF